MCLPAIYFNMLLNLLPKSQLLWHRQYPPNAQPNDKLACTLGIHISKYSITEDTSSCACGQQAHTKDSINGLETALYYNNKSLVCLCTLSRVKGEITYWFLDGQYNCLAIATPNPLWWQFVRHSDITSGYFSWNGADNRGWLISGFGWHMVKNSNSVAARYSRRVDTASIQELKSWPFKGHYKNTYQFLHRNRVFFPDSLIIDRLPSYTIFMN